jgi:hypothetical protein
MKWPFGKSFLSKTTAAIRWLRWWQRQSTPALHPAIGVAPDWNDRALPNPFFEGLAG